MLQKTRLMSPIEGVFRVAKKGGEVTLKLTDKGLTKVFETLDAASIRKN